MATSEAKHRPYLSTSELNEIVQLFHRHKDEISAGLFKTIILFHRKVEFNMTVPAYVTSPRISPYSTESLAESKDDIPVASTGKRNSTRLDAYLKYQREGLELLEDEEKEQALTHKTLNNIPFLEGEQQWLDEYSSRFY